MTTIKSVTAAVAAAAALAGGTLYVMNSSAPAAWTMPEFDLAPLELAPLGGNTLTLAALDRPAIDIPAISAQEIGAADIDTAGLDQAEIVSAALGGVDAQMHSRMLALSEALAVAADTRNLEYAPGEHLAEWIKINAEYADAPAMSYVPSPTGVRMITEVRMPTSQEEYETLSRNLKRAADLGYNAALVVYRTGDSPADLRNLARMVRAAGLAPWACYGGPERLEDTVLPDPVAHRAALEALAAECDGYLLGWRRTSLHLLIPDAGWTNWHVAVLRGVNPQIRIMGEIFFGYTAIDHPKVKIWHNLPRNCSGAIVFGYGYRGIAIERVLTRLLPRTIPGVETLPLYGVVLGDQPYYATTNRNQLTPAQNVEVKHALERRFQRAGAAGVVTISGDGNDHPEYPDNLSQIKDFFE